jgi:hypothetical protein
MVAIYSIVARTAKGTADNTSIGSAATISIYGGTRPATPDTAAGSTALVTFTMAGAFGSVASGVLTANSIPSANVTNTGTAVWARIATSGAVAVLDLDVSATTLGTFVGSIATDVLTVTGTPTLTLAVGMTFTGTGVTNPTTIVALGTGTGGAGTYYLNDSQTEATSETMTVQGAGDILLATTTLAVGVNVTVSALTITEN